MKPKTSEEPAATPPEAPVEPVQAPAKPVQKKAPKPKPRPKPEPEREEELEPKEPQAEAYDLAYVPAPTIIADMSRMEKEIQRLDYALFDQARQLKKLDYENRRTTLLTNLIRPEYENVELAESMQSQTNALLEAQITSLGAETQTTEADVEHYRSTFQALAERLEATNNATRFEGNVNAVSELLNGLSEQKQFHDAQLKREAKASKQAEEPKKEEKKPEQPPAAPPAQQ